MHYSNNIEDAASLEINNHFVATLTLIDETPVTVQLANKEEADKLIKEWEDANLGEGDGGLCYESDAVMNVREELRKFRP